jgi:hypothetical protein
MSESKFTPGEWTACFAHDGKGTIFSWHVTGAKHGSTHQICGLRSVSPEMRSNEEDRANARLIAAAPELFEALRELVRVCSVDGSERHIFRRAEKALLKASPEQSE